MIVYCKYDELVDVNLLKNHPKNRNKHGQDQIERLSELYKYHGIRHPIIVSKRSGFIVAGHGRKLSAIRAGLKEMPIVYQDFENEEAEYAFLISDNAIAEWSELDLGLINQDVVDLGPDFNIDHLGIKDFTLDVNDKYQDKDADSVPENVPVKSKLGDLYILGNHRLLCGDSTNEDQVSRLMNGEKTQMVLSDPPYGMFLDTDFSGIKGSMGSMGRKNGTKGNKYNKVIGDHDDFSPELINTFFATFGYCKEMFLFGADYFAEHLPDKNSGSWLVWDKRKDSQADAIGAEFELCWSKQKHKRRMLRHDWFGFLSSNNSQDARNRVHPTQKPVTLFEDMIEQWGKDATNVVDLYGGSGSTLIACEKTNRKCFMMELDPHYIDVIIKRWQDFTGLKAKREDGVLWDDLEVISG